MKYPKKTVVADGQHIDSKAVFGRKTTIGNNVAVGDDVTIKPRARIGDDFDAGESLFLGSLSVVGDNADIGVCSVIDPCCTIGKNAYIASHTFIREGVHIGDGSTVCEYAHIGAGVKFGADVTLVCPYPFGHGTTAGPRLKIGDWHVLKWLTLATGDAHVMLVLHTKGIGVCTGRENLTLDEYSKRDEAIPGLSDFVAMYIHGGDAQ